MDKENLKDKKENDSVKKSSTAYQSQEEFSGDSMVSYLTQTMGISRTMVAALLDITERTLSTWSTQSLDKLSESGSKAKRLSALYNFIILAERLKVPNKAMVSLIQEPVDSEDIHGNTPLYFIIEEPSSKCFVATSELIIKKFLTLL